MAEAIVVIEGIQFVLQAIGFNAAESASIMEAGLSEFEDFRYLVEKDIHNMSDEFASVLRQTDGLSLD